MADPTDVIAQFTAALQALEARLGSSSNAVRGSIDAFNQFRSANFRASQAFNTTQQAMQGMTRATTDARSAMQANTRFERTMSSELQQLARAVRSGTTTTAESEQAYHQMISAIRQNRDMTIEQRTELIKTIAVERRRAEMMATNERVMQGLNSVTQPLTNAIVGTTQAYQQGGFALASFVGKNGLMMASTMLGRFGDGLVSLGGYMGPRSLIGQGLGALGGIIRGLSDTARNTIEKAWDPLMQETLKLLSTFQNFSSMGVVFANGIDGMNKAARDAGIGADKLAAIMKNNSEDIAKMGMGMTEGARQIGQVGDIMRRKGVTESLARLGYTAEEITDMIAHTTSQMQMGGKQVNNEEIAQATAQYAKDLKQLQMMTGEDVRAREKEAKARNNTLAFNQKLMDMEPAQRDQVQKAMAGLSAREQAILREKIINNGQAFTKESLMYESMVDGVSDKMNDLYGAFNDGTLSLGTVTERSQAYSERIRRSIGAQTDLALAAEAGVGAVRGVASDMNEGLDRAMRVNPESYNRTQVEMMTAMSEQVGRNTTELAALEVAAKALEAEIGKLITDSGAIALFGQGLVGLTRLLQEAVPHIRGLVGRGPPEPPAPTAPPPIADPGTGMPLPGAEIPAPTPPRGTDGNPIITRDPVLEETIQRLQGIPNRGNPQLANGGVVNFPTTGAPADLHGREAVIPLPSGLNIQDLANLEPQMRKNLTEMVAGLSERDQQIMSEKMAHPAEEAYPAQMLKPMNESRELMETLNHQMAQMNENLQLMLSETRNISTYTERTARGVA